MIAGDTNKYDLQDPLGPHLDIIRLATPVTRGDEHLDEIFLNFNDQVQECQAGQPLENEAGILSNHKSLIVEASLTQCHHFEWVTYHARDMRTTNKEMFVNEYCKIDWEAVIGGGGKRILRA